MVTGLAAAGCWSSAASGTAGECCAGGASALSEARKAVPVGESGEAAAGAGSTWEETTVTLDSAADAVVAASAGAPVGARPPSAAPLLAARVSRSGAGGEASAGA